MKKPLALLLSLIIALCCALPAFADMGGPMPYQFEGVVTAADGADLLDSDYVNGAYTFSVHVHVDNGTVLQVNGTYEFGGKAYCTVSFYGAYLYVEADKITAKEGYVGEEKTEDYSDSFRIIVLAEGGVPMRKGPSEAFEVMRSIPKGTVIECRKGLSKFRDNSEYSYVTYNGASGWIWTYTSDPGQKTAKIGYMPEKGSLTKLYVFSDKCVLREKADDASRAVTSAIPADTQLEYEYYVSLHTDERVITSYYAKYDGKKGWLIDKYDENFGTAFCEAFNETVLLSEPFTAYTGFDSSEKADVRLEALEPYRAVYSRSMPGSPDYDDGRVALCTQGKIVWIRENEHPGASMRISSVDVQPVYSWTRLWSDIDLEGEGDVTVQYGDKVIYCGEIKANGQQRYCYIVGSDFAWRAYDGSGVFTQYENYEVKSYEDLMRALGEEPEPMETEPETTTEAQTDETQRESAMATKTAPTEKEEKPSHGRRVLSPLTFAILCIAATVIVAVTAIVCILLLRKQKQNGEGQ